MLVLVCDTLRADAVGAYDPPSRTPNLDAWAAAGVRFDAAYAHAPWTLPSFASLMTGRLPAAHGALRAPDGELLALGNTVETLPEHLAEAGYATAAVLTNPYLAPRFGLDRGFDDYAHLREPGKRAKVDGEKLVETALEVLADREDEPLFLLLHLFDPHMPYDPPVAHAPFWAMDAEARSLLLRRLWEPNGAQRLEEADRDRVRALYHAEVAYVDALVGRVIAALEPDAADWLRVFTSDHGEEFWDHGGFEHGHSMHEELLRVPLLVAWPDAEAPRGTAHTGLVRQIDVAPTVLAAAGVAPPENLPGRDLRDLVAGRLPDPLAHVAHNCLYGSDQRALVLGDLKLIEEPDTQSVKLFDLASDPAERDDLAEREPELAGKLQAELVRLLDLAERSAAAPRRVEVDADLEDELRALGYVR